MIKKIVLVILILAIPAFAQEEFHLKESICEPFLCFSDSNRNIMLFMSKIYRSKDNDTGFTLGEVTTFSSGDGKVIRTIPVFQKSKEYVLAFNVSNDGSSFIVLTADAKWRDIYKFKKQILKEDWFEFSYELDETTYSLRKYLLNENRWEWKKKWYGERPPLRLAYSEDKKRIIGVNTQGTVVIDAETGSLIRASKSIASISGSDTRFLKYNISRSGRYFAFWWSRYLTWSVDDEAGGERLLDISWYGLNWLIHFGAIPNYCYIWDVERDTVFDRIRIPYKTVRGTPVFTNDENDLLLDIDCNYKLYSLVDKSLNEKMIQNECTHLSIQWGAYSDDFKVISPDNTYLAACSDSGKISVINYNDGRMLKKFEQVGYRVGPASDLYPMSFSSDGKYFAVVTNSYIDTIKGVFGPYFEKRGSKLNLFDTSTWQKIWDVDLSKKE